MFYQWKRHPFPVTALFRHSLVLTYAFPSEILAPLLPPGLTLDTYRGAGFFAIALVQAERLHPSFLPAALGRDCFLAGYRIFARFGSSLRGLRILRSATGSRWMQMAGNLFTHYQYSLCRAQLVERPGEIEWTVCTPHAEADLRVIAQIGSTSPLPSGSPFATEKDARRFAGPLPYTFDYEPETHSIIRIQGVRSQWKPQPVSVEVRENSFLAQEPFRQAAPVLANAFYLSNLPYRWQRGIRTPL